MNTLSDVVAEMRDYGDNWNITHEQAKRRLYDWASRLKAYEAATREPVAWARETAAGLAVCYMAKEPRKDHPWPEDPTSKWIPLFAAAPAAPGWKLVPVEPTREMKDACDNVRGPLTAWRCFKEMLAAAPEPPVAPRSGDRLDADVGQKGGT